MSTDAQPVIPLEGRHQGACVNMESVNRIAKLPVVESTIQTATNIYEKVKVRNLLFLAKKEVYRNKKTCKSIISKIVKCAFL